MYTIIEDCSPYYIRFKFDKLSSIIGYLKSLPESAGSKQYQYTHINLTRSQGNPLFQMLPLTQQLELQRDRFGIFSTPPGGGCGIHKDADDHKVSINIPIMILDDKCITSWYDESQFEGLEVQDAQKKDTHKEGYTRSIFPEYKEMHKFTPCKTVICKPNEAMILNTDIYHSWDNSKSNNWRKVLTLRPVDTKNVTYDSVRQLLLENET